MTILKTKILATMMVAIMTFSGAVVMMDSESNDAATWEPNGTGDIYSYTLHYDSSEMENTAAQELQLTVANMTPISHTVGTTTLSSLANEGSWGFDTTTGIGPFNSFYAAFDITDGNKFYAIMNPYNLTETIDGISISSSISDYNVMWVLPTVYWKAEENGDLTLTNDSTAGGVAYAHTVDGHTYKYLAYGVYESSTATVGGQTVLVSQSGLNPVGNQTRDTFRQYAHNYTMDSSLGGNAHSMLWNFYQTELYKYCGYVVMEGFNSKNIVGNGKLYVSSTPFTPITGLTKNLGPYAGNPGVISGSGSNYTSYGVSSVKLFIEDAWGSYDEFIDGVLYNVDLLYVDTSSNPSDLTTGDYVEAISIPSLQSGFFKTISTSEKIWGMGATSDNTMADYLIGTTDGTYRNESPVNMPMENGGGALSGGSNYTSSLKNGIGSLKINGTAPTFSSATLTSRLMFVADSILPEYDVTFTTVNASEYGGSISGNSVSNVVMGTTINVSENTVTIGETTITATTQPNTAQYTYDVTWSVNDGDVVTQNMTITATFTRVVNTYAVSLTIDPETDWGTLSAASFPTAEYGSTLAVSDNVLTNGTDSITATPDSASAQYTWGFDGFYIGDVKITDPVTVTGATSVVAKFTQTLNSYTITWDLDYDSLTETTSVDYGVTPTYTPEHRLGYNFVGWNPTPVPVTGTATYTAQWEAIPTITVTFDPEQGTMTGPTQIEYNTLAPYGELPTVTAKPNYEFKGWYTQENGQGDLITVDSIVPDQDITLYAFIEPSSSYAPIKAIMDILPILVVIGIVLGAVAMFFYGSRTGMNGRDMIYAIVGVSVAILVVSAILMPILNGM